MWAYILIIACDLNGNSPANMAIILKLEYLLVSLVSSFIIYLQNQVDLQSVPSLAIATCESKYMVGLLFGIDIEKQIILWFQETARHLANWLWVSLYIAHHINYANKNIRQAGAGACALSNDRYGVSLCQRKGAAPCVREGNISTVFWTKTLSSMVC